jgi:hypothetical protein
VAQRFAVRTKVSVQRPDYLAQNTSLSAPVSIPRRSRLPFSRSGAGGVFPRPPAPDRLTTTLSERVGEDLRRKLEIPLVLHLVQAGLTPWLERKLVVHGELISLRTFCEEQHQALTLTDRAERRG